MSRYYAERVPSAIFRVRSCTEFTLGERMVHQ